MKVVGQPRVVLQITIQLSEEEARALDALAGYGDDAFIKVFYEKLGTAYMKQHEQGLRTFLKTVRTEIPWWLKRANEAREAFKEQQQ